MNPAHHLNRSRHYLNFIPANIAPGDYARAARALCRSVSHAVTAAAVHWHHRRDTRRRLRLVVGRVPFQVVGLCKVRDAALAVPGFPLSQERGITKRPETERCPPPGIPRFSRTCRPDSTG